MEIHLWKKIAKLILPLLVLTALLNILDAFFWTIGPLFAESFRQLGSFDGVFLTAYTLPALLIGWFVGNVTNRLGKKRTAFIAFSLGSLLLIGLALTTNPLLTIGIIFISSCFTTIAWPAINGAYADYIAETPRVEKEIEGVEDFATNIGYIIGPMLAGVLADTFGLSQSFALFGIIGCVIGVILFFATPRSINITPAKLQ